MLLLLPLCSSAWFTRPAGPSGSEESTPPSEIRPVGEKEEALRKLGSWRLVLFVAGVPSALYLAWRLRRDGPDTSPTDLNDGSVPHRHRPPSGRTGECNRLTERRPRLDEGRASALGQCRHELSVAMKSPHWWPVRVPRWPA